MPFNVFHLVNTCHALGFSALLMVDALTSFRCHLQAIEMRLDARVSTDWDIECLVFDWTQIGVVLRLGFIAKQRSGFGFDYMLFSLMRGNNPRTPL